MEIEDAAEETQASMLSGQRIATKEGHAAADK